MASVDIIIVNWNSGTLLEDCVRSLRDSILERNILNSIIIVDNDSSDNSMLFLDERMTYNTVIKTIKNSENNGFAKACNQGANESEADYLLFLNPDTRIYPDTLEKCLDFIVKDDNYGVLGIQLHDENDRLSTTCRYFPTKLRRLSRITGFSKLFPVTGIEMKAFDHQSTRKVDQIMGAFFLLKNSIFRALNGFDERFFIYYEEVDLCKRVVQEGYSNIFYSGARAFHKIGGTTSQVMDLRTFYNLRSWLQYEKKHKGKSAQYTALFIVYMEYFSRFIYLVISNHKSEIIQLNRAYDLLRKNLWTILREKR